MCQMLGVLWDFMRGLKHPQISLLFAGVFSQSELKYFILVFLEFYDPNAITHEFERCQQARVSTVGVGVVVFLWNF